MLLVGGASSRFGSPKTLAQLPDGSTLAEVTWSALAWCDQRIAVGKVADRLTLPFPILDDGSSVRAPIAGVVGGLRLAAHDLCVFLPVDLPLIQPDDLRALAAACRDAAAVPTGPLPGAYRRRALVPLQRQLERGRLALRDAVSELDTAVVSVTPERLANINQPDDLKALVALGIG